MLLEVLVALLIFAFGVLGLVGMQAISIKLTADSKYRAEAAVYADQLISQMWADDRTHLVLKGNYETSNPKYIAWRDQIQAVGTGLPGASGANAPTVTIVAEDLATPPVTNQVSVVTISIFWRAPEEAAAHKYVTVARLN